MSATIMFANGVEREKRAFASSIYLASQVKTGSLFQKSSIVFQSVSLDDSTCSTCATNRFPISALPTQSGTTAHSASDPVASHRPSPSAHSPASTGDPDSGAEQYDLPINFKDKAEWGIPSDEIILDTEIGAPPHKKRHISAECDKTSGPSSSAERNRRARSERFVPSPSHHEPHKNSQGKS